ncbi:MAG: penicillin-binding transpeptidase domain-containing protein [Oscillospiraceae bacterium]|nr:penicillin-binding transpeptidase domain-containing protein [Oscillospiraceae bacterium]
MPKKKFFIRYFLILAVFILAAVVYGAALLNLQFARAEEFLRRIRSTYSVTFVIPAARGEIFDRNGEPLVTNKISYDIIIDGTKMSGRNIRDHAGKIIGLVEKIELFGGRTEPDSFPVILIEKNGAAEYSYSMELASNPNERVRLDRFLAREENKLSPNISAEELAAFLTAKYRLDEHMPPETRDPAIFRKILGICYDFDRLNILAGDNKYKISSDINESLRTLIAENAANYPGAEIRRTYERVYHYPESMPHILGTIGQIPAGRQDWYLERGYELDAIVGRDGAERAFEEYLRGEDGIIERTYDQDNNIVNERFIKEPVAGKNIFLTIDIKLQRVAEYSLGKTIGRIHELAYTRDDPRRNGLDANAGAAAVTDPNTGEVLALATYPSYDISLYGEKYGELEADPDKPLFNRATMGLYAPGSVFKIATSVAALCSGDINPNTHILDRGKYTEYQDYQPECWRYSMYGVTHGYINVGHALEVSCNYFYYTVGQRMGINTLTRYSRLLGLGELTGIEIGETAGVLASREAKEASGGVWVGGDLLQASIGQSINQFSPLQTANMLATVVNGGDRYKCRLLSSVKEYGTDNIYYSPGSEIINSVDISAANLDAVASGMRNAIATGTGAILFNRIPVQVGGKTGTVQVAAGRSNDATFVAFAPYNNPRLSVSVVIEKGAHGSWAGFAAEDIIEYYFGYKTFEEAMDMDIGIDIDLDIEDMDLE